jgi:YD repeat-containing protein
VSTTADGVVTKHVIDGVNLRAIDTVDQLGPAQLVTNHSFDDQGHELDTSVVSGVETQRDFTASGLTVKETVDPSGSSETTNHAFDSLGRETKTVDPNGGTTRTAFDLAGRVCRVVANATMTDAAWAALASPCTDAFSGSPGTNQVTTTTYDRAGNAVSSTDPAGILTTTVYDPLNRSITLIANDVASPTLPTQDVTTRTCFDAAGTTIAVKDPRGISSRMIPNARGVATTAIANCTDSGTTPTSNPPACTGAGTHDATTNVVASTVYDGEGSAIQTVNAVGTGAAATTTTVYDGDGRVQAVQDRWARSPAPSTRATSSRRPSSTARTPAPPCRRPPGGRAATSRSARKTARST